MRAATAPTLADDIRVLLKAHKLGRLARLAFETWHIPFSEGSGRAPSDQEAAEFTELSRVKMDAAHEERRLASDLAGRMVRAGHDGKSLYRYANTLNGEASRSGEAWAVLMPQLQQLLEQLGAGDTPESQEAQPSVEEVRKWEQELIDVLPRATLEARKVLYDRMIYMAGLADKEPYCAWFPDGKRVSQAKLKKAAGYDKETRRGFGAGWKAWHDNGAVDMTRRGILLKRKVRAVVGAVLTPE